MPIRSPRHTQGWTRHLEGWQPAVLSVLIAGSVAALVVPRSVEPADVPPPAVNERVLEDVRRADQALCARAEREPLDADVRALGSALRAYGRADAAGDETDETAVWDGQRRIADTVPAALAVGEADVLRLRAYQLERFLMRVRQWEATGEIAEELLELGGGFLAMLRRNGWCEGCEEGSGTRRVLADDAAVRAMYKLRWNELTGITKPSFEPSLDERRALYRFFFAHPIAAGRPNVWGEKARQTAYAYAYALKKVEEFSAIDPAYPVSYARGILLYRLGRFRDAATAFQRHLEGAPDGPYTLRAHNYLRASLEKALSP